MTERLRALAPVVVLVLVLGGCCVAVATAPALADVTGGDPQDYVLEEDGTVVIDGDLATDCRSFASSVPRADDDPYLGQARRVLAECEEAGLLPSKSTNPSAPAANGRGGGLPDTGGPTLMALVGVSGVLAMTGCLLARKILEDE